MLNERLLLSAKGSNEAADVLEYSHLSLCFHTFLTLFVYELFTHINLLG